MLQIENKKKNHIVVVDDNPLIATLVGLLSFQDYQVHVAQDLEEAGEVLTVIEKDRDKNIEGFADSVVLVYLDLQLGKGGQNTIKLAQEIREKYPLEGDHLIQLIGISAVAGLPVEFTSILDEAINKDTLVSDIFQRTKNKKK